MYSLLKQCLYSTEKAQLTDLRGADKSIVELMGKSQGNTKLNSGGGGVIWVVRTFEISQVKLSSRTKPYKQESLLRESKLSKTETKWLRKGTLQTKMGKERRHTSERSYF